MPHYSDRASRIDTENAFKIGPYILELEAAGKRVIKCNLGEPDFAVPLHIREEVKRQLDLDNTHYNDPQGILPLRRAIAKQINETRGLQVTPAHVVVFPGAKPSIGLCQQTYTNPGDEIIYPSPGFPIYESFIPYVQAKAVPLHLDEAKGFAFTGAELEPLISERTRLIYINFPANPTGGVATLEQLEGIAEVILRKAPKDVRVYADEVYEDILFDGAVHRSIASVPGMAERTIVTSGVSKGYCWTGGRIGWAAFPTLDEAQVFKNLNINYFSCVPAYNQEGARVAIESPLSKPIQREMAAEFQHRRDVFVAALNAIDGITCQLPRGAFYVFPNVGGVCERLGAIDAWRNLPPEVQRRTSPATLLQMFLLFGYQVATMDRKSFGRIGTEGMHYLRVSIATGLADLEEAARRIATAAGDRAGFAAFVAAGHHLY